MSRSDGLRGRVGRGFTLPALDRRSMLIGGGAAAGLAIAYAVWPRSPGAAINAAPGEQVLGNFLKIGTDGHVTVLVPQTETGQGSYTAIAQIVADELGADWRTVAVEPAPISEVYANSLLLDEDAALATPRTAVPEAIAAFGGWRRVLAAGHVPAMLTGGSTGVRMFEAPARESAAFARALLAMAAARRWDADWQACEAADGFVILGNRRLRFGELAAAAALLDPPRFAPLRAPGSGILAGKPMPRLDLPAKIDGSLNFAADVRLPDMAYAAIRQGPIGDTRLKSYRRTAADRIAGFIAAVPHDRWLAAVATNGWAAQRALDAMAPVFTSIGQRADSGAIDRRLKAAVNARDGARISSAGNIADAFAGRPVLTADYVVAPALHAPIETRSATAAPDGDRMRLWVSSQAPGLCRAAVAAALDIDESAVALFQMPAGGAFGIGMEHEVAIQAALIARAMRRPVQLSWSRTEEILRDLPRAPARARLQGSLSSGSTIDGWHAAIATPPARHEWRARLTGTKPHAAMADAAGSSDAAAVGGAHPPYAIPHVAIDHLPVDVTLPSGYWRGNADSFTAFFTECFVDEMAHAAEVEPLGFRMAMLGSRPDLARCLQTVASIGEWDGGTAGSGQGLACHSMRGSHIAVMAVAKPGGSGLVVERLIAVADVGRVINPTLVRQQIEGGLVFGLAMATGATTRYARGLARARRMGDINLPRLAQMPAIRVVLMDSRRDPGGVGELAVPVVAPAIANALFTVTARRIRRMPLSEKPLP